MGGDIIIEDWDITSNAISTLVLLGKIGNGKSATGNSILNRKAFKAQAHMSGVTSTCILEKTVMEDGREVNVIDTPGIFDSSKTDEFNYKEIMKCIDLAKEGIHAVLVVFSARCRYSKEEAATLNTLQDIFGEKITNYMILIFTGGDELEKNEVSFEQFICDCPPEFQDVLAFCEQRVVLFDNQTTNVAKRARQTSQLLSLVDSVVAQNNGQPYFNKPFAEVARGAASLDEKMKELEPLAGDSKPETLESLDRLNKQSDDQLKRFVETLETKLRETTERLERKLEEENKARLKAEKEMEGAKMKWEKTRLKAEREMEWGQKKLADEIRRLQERLENAKRSRSSLCSSL